MRLASTLCWFFLTSALWLPVAACSDAPNAGGHGGASAGASLAASSGSGVGGSSGAGGAAAGAAGTPAATAGAAGATDGAAGSGGSGGAGGSGGGSASGGGGGAAVSGSAAWTRTPFIMDTWFWNDMPSAASAIATVKQSGYAGFALSADHAVTDYVSAAAAATTPMPIVGIWVSVAADAYPTGIVDSIAGTGGLVLLSLTGGHAASDPAGDAKALELVGKLADECKQKALPGVALYPHVGFWLERVSDAVRLASKAARSDVGVVFNQYHWMKAEGGKELEATLKSTEPFLKVVTINGSDLEGSILPLGQGAYDVKPILQTLAKLDFHGSVGLQGYSITGDIGSKLQSSKLAFDALLGTLK